MNEAALHGLQAVRAHFGVLRPGIAEIEVAAELEHKARRLGAEGMSFETIVASGVALGDAARPRDRCAPAAAGVRDAGLRYNPQGLLFGYDADRLSGQAKARGAAAYEAVLEAQETAVNAVAAGVSCARGGRGRTERFAQGGIGGGIYPLHRAWRWAGDSRAAASWRGTEDAAAGRHGDYD